MAGEPGMTDAERFEAFVLEFQDMVFATAVRLLGGAPEAEDIAQTVFLRAFERFDAIASSPTAAGWLKAVTTNLCLNHLSRYRARWQFFSEMDRPEDDGGFAAGLPDASTVQADLEAGERHAQLEQALRDLPDHQRVPLVLFHFEDMGYQEIASRMGVSAGRIKTDIHRGRAILRKTLLPR